MIGVLVNVAAVLAGSSVGLLMKKGISKKVSDAVMKALALCVLVIGFDGALKCNNAIIMIVSMVFGTILGEWLNIDGGINRFGDWVQSKLAKNSGESRISEGLVTASLLFCVGSMTLVGSINAGLTGDNTLLFTKSALDLISSCMLASSLGIGVMLAAIVVLVLQGGIVLAAGLLATVLTDAAMIAEITAVGSVMIIGMGLNMLGITKIKVANCLPALVITPFVYLFVTWLTSVLG